MLEFLERFDRLAHLPLGINSECLQSVDDIGRVTVFLRGKRLITSWDALYFRLRANFDGLVSEYYPHPPSLSSSSSSSIAGGGKDGGSTAVYDVGKRVVEVEEVAEGVRVVYTDGAGDKREEAIADLVLGADGPNSVVRKCFLPPGIAERQYAGYVAWRGVVPEREVSDETRKIFSANISYSIIKDGHVIV